MLYFNYKYLKYNIMRNEDFNQSTKTSFLQSRIIMRNSKIAFSLIMMMFSLSNGFSQASNQRAQIITKDAFLNSLSVSNTRNSTEYNHVLGLLNNSNSSLYLSNGQVRTYGQIPVCMYTDLASLSIADRPDLPTNDIEIVTIKIGRASEITGPIDLTTICNYKNVKYIHIKLNFDMEASQLTRLIKNCNPKCVVFFSVEKIS
jgi:hypothetical protein